jgi:FkbM family methyltransferase
MEIKYYDLKEIGKNVRQQATLCPTGWFPYSFGGLKARHFSGQAHLDRAKMVHTTDRPAINESAYELCVELSVLQTLDVDRIVFMELGAGWGGQTVQVVTAVRNQVVPMAPTSVYTYAVEAEPGHYRFLCETFQQNWIEGVPIFGAVSSTLGWPLFYAEKAPEDNYGQSLHPRGNIAVPSFTLANLMATFKIEDVHFLHMDIQGAEPDAIRGADINMDRFWYVLVCPHYQEHVDSITQLMVRTHDLVCSFGPQSGYHDVPGFPLPVHFPQDGMMLWERKDI